MLQKNVVIGGEYLTYIGKELRRVRVDREVKRTSWGHRSGDRQVTRFICTELRTGKQLPKPRSSSSLRPVNDIPSPSALHCKWCRRAFPLPQPCLPRTLSNRQDERDAHERVCEKNPAGIDVRVTADVAPASVYAFELRSQRAREWVDANVVAPQFIGTSTLVVEHRYASLLVEGLREAGFTVA